MSPLRKLKIYLRSTLNVLGIRKAPSRLSQSLKVEGLTYLSHAKLIRIEEALQSLEDKKLEGGIAEFGVALGGSAVLLARTAKAQGRVFHGFDVFTTIPEPTSDKDDAASKERYKVIVSGQSKGINEETYYGYLDDLYERVSATLTRYGVPPEPGKIMLHKGLFEETVPNVDLAPLAFAHIDCDWYDPVCYCLKAVDAVLVPGGMIILDDYHDYGGAKTAMDEFVSEHPEYHVIDGRNPMLVKRA
ncbi:TylF/MycF/NovP-related O-methyltransferase [Dinoroseobacter sp. S76]|uniref:TylF/MycF/NovP-related O-methyltransferase n=1 Tax=Dinoroseobacter sp. S76 TaxID=3415124 RepID=UPI003C7A3902